MLVTDDGEAVLRRGDCAGFPAGDRNGHHVLNRAANAALLLEIGSRRPEQDACRYPDTDLDLPPGSDRFHHKDGRAF